MPIISDDLQRRRQASEAGLIISFAHGRCSLEKIPTHGGFELPGATITHPCGP